MVVNEQCEAKCMIEVFPDRGWNSDGPKTLIRGIDSSCSANHTLPTQLKLSISN